MSAFCHQKKPEMITWQTEFDGVLSSDVCGHLTVELLKYIALERHQIPGPFDQLRAQLSKPAKPNININMPKLHHQTCAHKMIVHNETTTQMEIPSDYEGNNSNRDAKVPRVRVRKKTPLEDRKRQTAITHMDEILTNIEDTFKNVPYIEQVLVVLGSTPVSPKESFLIRLPNPGFYEGRLLSAGSCKRELFRKLVSCDLFSDMKLIGSTNFMVFVQAPRDCAMKWFQPKLSFKIPTRGQQFEFSLLSTCKPMNAEITQVSLCEFELSGIEPLEKTQDVSTDKELDDSLYDNFRKLDVSSDSDEHTMEHKHNLEESLLNGASPCRIDSELVWFQAPISMKGFKLKSKRGGLAENIWG